MDTNRSNREKHSHKVSLPDGSNVDIETEEGANAFPKGVSAFDQHFSSKLKEFRKLRKKKRPNARDEQKLEELYEFIFNQVTLCTEIPQSEVQEFLNYFIQEIKRFTKTQIWIKGGFLETSDYRLLFVCDVMFCRQAALASIALESEFFQVLANFIKARKGNGTALPKGPICASIGRIVHCALKEPALDSTSWSMEKIFKKFEACGILEQILRCSTVEELEMEACYGSNDSFNLILEKLQSCTSILTRKFKSGEPCGDSLKAILDGRDGSTNIPRTIFNRLKGIARLVETMDPKEWKAELAFGQCTYCSKNGNTEAPLCACGRCRLAHYCSKECQKAHWKIHKLKCQKLSKPERGREFSLHMVSRRFMKQNLETIFQAMEEKCDSTAGVRPWDLAVEFDLMPNENGVIPALHNPPMFKIVVIRDYISGQAIPEWYEGKDSDLTWFKDKLKQMTEERSASGALVVRHSGCLHVSALLPESRESDI